MGTTIPGSGPQVPQDTRGFQRQSFRRWFLIRVEQTACRCKLSRHLPLKDVTESPTAGVAQRSGVTQRSGIDGFSRFSVENRDSVALIRANEPDIAFSPFIPRKSSLDRHHRQGRKDLVAGIKLHGHSGEHPLPLGRRPFACPRSSISSRCSLQDFDLQTIVIRPETYRNS